MVGFYGLAVLCKQGKVLLLQRANTKFGNGMYGLVGGSVEVRESALQAIVREVYEEVGLEIKPELFNLVHMFCRKGATEDIVAACFKVDISAMAEPYNKENTKHNDMQFFALHELPENILPAHKKALEHIAQGLTYSESGYELCDV